MPGPQTQLTLLPYAQDFNGTNLSVRLLLIPGGSPLDPLTPGNPAFGAAGLVLSAALSSGLTAMPPAVGAVTTLINSPAPAGAAALFTELGTLFPINPTPAPAKPRRTMTVLKHLPTSYLTAAGVTGAHSPFARTDDSYLCAFKKIRTPISLPNREAPISWGRVIAIALRQPVLAVALGLIRTITVPVTAGAIAHGGWLYVTLDASGDAGLLAVPEALALFATRIPPLHAPSSMFTPVLFPVPASTTADYDEPFLEAVDYSDGFAKIVHASQQQSNDRFSETDDGTRPTRETGIRLGWDDEQVIAWMNRQLTTLTPADPDTTMGVAGYNIDVREAGDLTWHSLNQQSGLAQVGTQNIGMTVGEHPVETPPVQLDADVVGEFWLGDYFTRWIGGAIIGSDPIGRQLSGAPAPTPGGVVPIDPGVPLLYGTTYELRVRLADHTGGGPTSADEPNVSGLNPIASLPFRRWVPLARPTVQNPATPDSAQVTVLRPRLAYPAYPCTAAPNAVAALLADIPIAKAAGREPSLPDPDAATARVTVLAQTLAFDPNATAGYVELYTAERPFPADADAPLTLDFDWREVHDASTLVDPGTGPIPLPKSRGIRLEVRAVARADAHLDYFGADDVRVGDPSAVELFKAASDERDLVVTGAPGDLLKAIYLQPDWADDPTVTAATNAAGPSGPAGTAVARLAATLGLDFAALTVRGVPGRRLVFGVAAGLRHHIGPDAGSITMASSMELTGQWLVAVQFRLDRDWTWRGLANSGIAILRDGVEVGRVRPLPTLAAEGEVDGATRTSTDFLFIDVVDSRPARGAFPAPTTITYTASADFATAPDQSDDPLIKQAITLPIAIPPVQVPELVSVGVALSPYEHDAGYTSTSVRQRALWLQFAEAPEALDDEYFVRVLRNAPDPLIAGSRDVEVPDLDVEPALPIDAEYTRVIVPGQTDDRAGMGAMQKLIPGDVPGYYLLPLPPGVHDTDPALLGFWTYEMRVGHAVEWSTAHGRFGNPLRVAGIQHPAPPLPLSVNRVQSGLSAGATFANPVLDGVSLRPFNPATNIWMLLYAQVTRADLATKQNVLLGRRRAEPNQKLQEERRGSNQLVGETSWTQHEIGALLTSIGLNPGAPLSVLAVEIFPNELASADPVGVDLGTERILRASALVAVPEVCD